MNNNTKIKEVMDVINNFYDLENCTELKDLLSKIEYTKTKTVEFLKENISELNIMNDQFKKDLPKLENQNINTDLIFKNISSKYIKEADDLKAKYNQEFVEKSAKISENQELLNKVKGLENRESNLVKENMLNNQKINDLEYEITKWKSMKTLPNNILDKTKELENEKQLIQDKYNLLEEENLKLQDKLQELQSEIKDLEKNISELNKSLQEKEDKYNNLLEKDKMPDPRDDLVYTLEEKINIYESNITLLTATNKSLENSTRKLEDDNKSLKLKVQENQLKLDRLDYEYKTKISDIKDNYEIELAKLNKSLGEVNVENNSFLLSITKYKDEIKLLTDKINSMKSEVDKIIEKDKEIIKLKEENANLYKRLGDNLNV